MINLNNNTDTKLPISPSIVNTSEQEKDRQQKAEKIYSLVEKFPDFKSCLKLPLSAFLLHQFNNFLIDFQKSVDAKEQIYLSLESGAAFFNAYNCLFIHFFQNIPKLLKGATLEIKTDRIKKQLVILGLLSQISQDFATRTIQDIQATAGRAPSQTEKIDPISYRQLLLNIFNIAVTGKFKLVLSFTRGLALEFSNTSSLQVFSETELTDDSFIKELLKEKQNGLISSNSKEAVFIDLILTWKSLQKLNSLLNRQIIKAWKDDDHTRLKKILIDYNRLLSDKCRQIQPILLNVFKGRSPIESRVVMLNKELEQIKQLISYIPEEFCLLSSNFTTLAITYLEKLEKKAPLKNLSADCDLSWLDKSFPSSIKKKNGKKTTNLSLDEEVPSEEINISISKVKIDINEQKSLEEILATKLTKVSELANKGLNHVNDDALSVIHEFTKYMTSHLQMISKQDDHLVEARSHLFLLGCSLDLFIRAGRDNRFYYYDLLTLGGFLHISVSLEQLMKCEHEQFYDTHELTYLLDQTNGWQNLQTSFETHTKSFNRVIHWARYPEIYSSIFSKTPMKVINTMNATATMAKIVVTSTFTIKDTVVPLEKIHHHFIQSVKTTYESVCKRINLPNELIKDLSNFFDALEQSFPVHLKEQQKKTVKIPKSTLFQEECILLKNTISSLDVAIEKYANFRTERSDNPILALQEAKRHILNLLCAMRLLGDYPHPLFSAINFKHTSLQGIIERLLDAQLMASGIPYENSHSFSEKQLLLFTNLLTINAKIDLEAKQSLYDKQKEFNCGNGGHYPHQTNEYNQGSNAWLKTFVNILKHSPDYIGYSKEEHQDFFSNNVQKTFTDAAQVIHASVTDCLRELKRVHQESLKKLIKV